MKHGGRARCRGIIAEQQKSGTNVKSNIIKKLSNPISTRKRLEVVEPKKHPRCDPERQQDTVSAVLKIRFNDNLSTTVPVKNFTLSESKEVLDQKEARTVLKQWLNSHKQKPKHGSFKQMSFILHGPTGIGKSTIAELCIKEADFSLVQFPSDILKTRSTETSLRDNGAVHKITRYTWESLTECIKRNEARTLSMKRSCLLVDNFKHNTNLSIHELSKLHVGLPIICTADFLSVREAASFQNHYKMNRPNRDIFRKWLLKEFSQNYCLNPEKIRWIFNNTFQDIRHACNMGQLVSNIETSGLYDSKVKDHVLPPYEWAAAILSKSPSQADLAKATAPELLSVNLLHENFLSFQENDINSCAKFYDNFAHIDLYESSLRMDGTSEITNEVGISNYTGCVLSFAASQNIGKRMTSSFTILNKPSVYHYRELKEATHKDLLSIKYGFFHDKHSSVFSDWDIKTLAKYNFNTLQKKDRNMCKQNVD